MAYFFGKDILHNFTISSIENRENSTVSNFNIKVSSDKLIKTNF